MLKDWETRFETQDHHISTEAWPLVSTAHCKQPRLRSHASPIFTPFHWLHLPVSPSHASVLSLPSSHCLDVLPLHLDFQLREPCCQFVLPPLSVLQAWQLRLWAFGFRSKTYHSPSLALYSLRGIDLLYPASYSAIPSGLFQTLRLAEPQACVWFLSPLHAGLHLLLSASQTTPSVLQQPSSDLRRTTPTSWMPPVAQQSGDLSPASALPFNLLTLGHPQWAHEVLHLFAWCFFHTL